MFICFKYKLKDIYANQKPSQVNPIKVTWKAQRLMAEDGTNNANTSAEHGYL